MLCYYLQISNHRTWILSWMLRFRFIRCKKVWCCQRPHLKSYLYVRNALSHLGAVDVFTQVFSLDPHLQAPVQGSPAKRQLRRVNLHPDLHPHVGASACKDREFRANWKWSIFLLWPNQAIWGICWGKNSLKLIPLSSLAIFTKFWYCD